MNGISVSRGDQYHTVPNGAECQWILNRWLSGKQMTRGQMTVIDLMRKGF